MLNVGVGEGALVVSDGTAAVAVPLAEVGALIEALRQGLAAGTVAGHLARHQGFVDALAIHRPD